MKTKGFSIFFITVILICYHYQSKAQVIFRDDKPMLMPVWYRIADYSPSLRSVESAEISPDGRYVVSGGKFGSNLMFWRVPDGELLWEKVLKAEIEAVTFSPDGKYIAVGDEAYNISIFDYDGNSIRVIEHDVAFDGITWSPNGEYVAGGSENGEVVLINTNNWQQEMILDAGGGTVNSLQFSKNTKFLIAAGNRLNDNPKRNDDTHGFVKAWDVSNDWNVLFDFRAQDRSTKSVRFHPDEKSFAIGNVEGEVKIYSFPEAKELTVRQFGERVEAVAYHPEGNFLFVADHNDEMNVLHTKTHEVVHKFTCRRVEYIHFSNDGRLMATSHEGSGLLTLYMFWSKVKSNEIYRQLEYKILKNKDLQ